MPLKKVMPVALAIPYIVLPLFPAFITLTAVTVPGVSLIPRSVTIALLVLMALLAVYAVVMLLAWPVEHPPTLLPLLGWLAAVFIATLMGFAPAAGILFICIFGLGIIWHLTLLRYYAQPGVTRAIFWSYVVSGAAASLIAIVMVLLREPANQYAIGHGRAIGTFILPGELAGYLILFLPIVFVLAKRAHDVRLRAASWIALFTGAVAFVLTFSRAGWMGLAAAIAFYVFATRLLRRRYAPLILLTGLAAVLVAFNVHHDPAENYTRLSIWQAGLEIARRFPLTGIGPFDFARIYPLVRLPDGDAQAFHAHSFLLTSFAETGITGVAAVIVAWWRFGVALRDRLQVAPPVHATVALAVAAGLVGTWVQGLIDTVSVVIFGLWLPSMALALAAAAHGLGDVG